MTSQLRKILLRFGFVLLAGVVCSALSFAQRPAARQFERGEELVYEAEFSRALLRGVDVADFRFSATRVPLVEHHGANVTNPTQSARQYSLQFTGELKSKGFFSRLFNLTFLERVTSIVEPGSFAVQNTKRFDQQGKRVRSSETVYDRVAGKVIWTEKDPTDDSRQPRVTSSAFSGQVQDVLSAIYFLRTQPLEIGKTFQLSVSDSGRVYQVPIRVIEKKRMKTVLGRVETVRVDADVFGARGMIGKEGQFSIWLTTDERHIPVKARIKSEYGTFDIKLKQITQRSARTSA